MSPWRGRHAQGNQEGRSAGLDRQRRPAWPPPGPPGQQPPHLGHGRPMGNMAGRTETRVMAAWEATWPAHPTVLSPHQPHTDDPPAPPGTRLCPTHPGPTGKRHISGKRAGGAPVRGDRAGLPHSRSPAFLGPSLSCRPWGGKTVLPPQPRAPRMAASHAQEREPPGHREWLRAMPRCHLGMFP